MPIFQRVKICEIPHVILETTSQFSFKFCILHQSSVPSNIASLYYYSSNIIYFFQKEPINPYLGVFVCMSMGGAGEVVGEGG